ncbi:MAG TPA: CGNR zinc finger domain-containing protein [Actinomycetota bacterium]|nr:CGNR zinc finger domain-containing protein [Actinomycetota bacterium]
MSRHFAGVHFEATMFDIQQHLSASTPAPGDLEILQRFLNLHEHAADGATLDPPLDMVRTFLVERGLLTPEQRFTEADRETYMELRRALRTLIEADDGEPLAPGDAEVIDRLGVEAGLHPHFHAEHAPTLEPRGHGVAAAFGRIVAIAFVASFDGSFEHLKLCASEDCRAVFYDRSKNHSGRWCSMETCGNRAKVRAWRERRRVTS